MRFGLSPLPSDRTPLSLAQTRGRGDAQKSWTIPAKAYSAPLALPEGRVVVSSHLLDPYFSGLQGLSPASMCVVGPEARPWPACQGRFNHQSSSSHGG